MRLLAVGVHDEDHVAGRLRRQRHWRLRGELEHLAACLWGLLRSCMRIQRSAHAVGRCGVAVRGGGVSVCSEVPLTEMSEPSTPAGAVLVLPHSTHCHWPLGWSNCAHDGRGRRGASCP